MGNSVATSNKAGEVMYILLMSLYQLAVKMTWIKEKWSFFSFTMLYKEVQHDLSIFSAFVSFLFLLEIQVLVTLLFLEGLKASRILTMLPWKWNLGDGEKCEYRLHNAFITAWLLVNVLQRVGKNNHFGEGEGVSVLQSSDMIATL